MITIPMIAPPAIAPTDDLAEHHLHKAVRALREDPQQPALPLEQTAQSLRGREGHVPVRDVVEDLLDQALAEQGAALGLAAWAEVAGLAADPTSRPIPSTDAISTRPSVRSDWPGIGSRSCCTTCSCTKPACVRAGNSSRS